MRAFYHYIEGAKSAFTLFPDFELPEDPDLQLPVRRPRMTIREAMEKDREALRGDFKKAWKLTLEEANG